MALEYGFGVCDQGDAVKTAKWQERYNNLCEKDQEFFHDQLSFMLMFTDVGAVTEKTIPHIIARLSVFRTDVYRGILKGLESEIKLEDYLKRFIGFTANVCTISTSEFIKKRTKSMSNCIPKLTSAEAQAISEVPDINTGVIYDEF